MSTVLVSSVMTLSYPYLSWITYFHWRNLFLHLQSNTGSTFFVVVVRRVTNKYNSLLTLVILRFLSPVVVVVSLSVVTPVSYSCHNSQFVSRVSPTKFYSQNELINILSRTFITMLLYNQYIFRINYIINDKSVPVYIIYNSFLIVINFTRIPDFICIIPFPNDKIVDAYFDTFPLSIWSDIFVMRFSMLFLYVKKKKKKLVPE